jgi:hypothetical protein
LPGGAKEASPIPPCEGGAGESPWGAREASLIPPCEGGAGEAPWDAMIRQPFLLRGGERAWEEGRASTRGSLMQKYKNTMQMHVFFER